MAELPDTVDFQFVGRLLLEFRRETREQFQAIGRELASLRDDMQGVRDQEAMTVASVMRVERSLSATRQDILALFEAVRHLRERIDADHPA